MGKQADLSNRIDFIAEEHRIYCDIRDIVSVVRGLLNIPGLTLDRKTLAYFESFLLSVNLTAERTNDAFLIVRTKHLKDLAKKLNKEEKKSKIKVQEIIEATEENFDELNETEEDIE